MAIFSKNEELNRQGQRVPFKRAQGLNKGLLSVLGYQDTGELNNWGKVSGGLGLSGNIAARGLSKGTDANEVIRSGTDEAANQTLQTMALGVNAAKAIANPASAGMQLLSGIKGQNKMKDTQAELDADVESSTYSRDMEDKTDVLNFNSHEEFAKHWEDKGYTVDPETNQILDQEGNLYDPSQETSTDDILNAATGVGEDAFNPKEGIQSMLTGDVMSSLANRAVAGQAYKSTLTDKVNKMQHKKDLDTLNYL